MVRIPGVQYTVGGALGRYDVSQPGRRAAEKAQVGEAAVGVVKTIADIAETSMNKKGESQSRRNDAQMAVWQKNFAKQYGGQAFIDGKPASDVLPELYEKEVKKNINEMAEQIDNPVHRARWLERANVISDEQIAGQYTQANRRREVEAQNLDRVSAKVLADNGLWEAYHNQVGGMDLEQSEKAAMHLDGQVNEIEDVTSEALISGNQEGLESLLTDFQAGRFDKNMPDPADRSAQVSKIKGALKTVKAQDKQARIEQKAFEGSLKARATESYSEGIDLLEKKYANDPEVRSSAIAQYKNWWNQRETETKMAKQDALELALQDSQSNPGKPVSDYPIWMQDTIRNDKAARAQDQVRPTQPIVLAKLEAMSDQDLAQVDLAEYRFGLSDADYLKVNKRMGGIKNNQPGAAQSYATYSKQYLDALGYKAKKIGDDEATSMVFNQMVSVLEVKQAELERDLTDTEIQTELGSFLVERAAPTNWRDPHRLDGITDDQANLLPRANQFLTGTGYTINQGNLRAAVEVLESLQRQADVTPERFNEIFSPENFKSQMEAYGVPPLAE